MLLAEYVFVSTAYSADALRARGGWWSGLGLLDPLAVVALATIAASLLTGRELLRSGVAELAAVLRRPPPLAPSLLVHGGAFVLFAAATSSVFGASFATAAHPGLWVAAWAAATAAVVASAVAIALPLGSIATVLGRLRRPLAVGVGLGVAAWLAGRATAELWWVLNRFTFIGAATVLRLAGQDVAADPDSFGLGIGDYRVTIAASCAGYEGIGVIVAFLGAFLWLERRQLRFPRAWLLLPLGVAAVLAANVLRIATLIWIGRWISPAMAEGSFHSKAGWVLYCSIALGTVAAARRSPRLARSLPTPSDETWNPSAVYLGPLLALLATALATGLITQGFDYLYPLRVIAVAAVLWQSRRLLPLRWQRPTWAAVGFGVAVFALWLALEPRPDAEHVAAWRTEIDAMPVTAQIVWVLFRTVGSVVTVPIAEELAFRGFLLRRLIAADFTEVSPRAFSWASFLISSLAFGALHQRWVAGTLAGCCYALAQRQRGRIEDAIAAHALTNALIAADALFLGAWWLWL